ncbi:class I SAM-dependent methyltransferase [Clostridium sp. 'White wine YQ']|uniref:class I SAM-dependent methyltransferase n=1 Tax=Clostridium sp. 'White wine YQ' TaxID=3027474 RepID=UPI0023673162|nr:class I SAM-dependent methyltransferase [Clostridium sp. 'White wine YQ']MDD7795351.1 methyltransferase domain-containing protein [Clostridium sp. 'White wine YQ']
MDLRFAFNEDAENYDKMRPTYCRELFNDIIEYSELTKDKKVIEIGIGTGQATPPFLLTGCTVTAVELGENLAEYSKEKFKEYKNLEVCNVSFEDFKCEDNSIDLIYSATAFHWIPEDIGYPKVHRLLKNNGVIALFWNKPFAAKEDYFLHEKIQGIYQKYRPANMKTVEPASERYKRISETIKSYGFKDVEMKLYNGMRRFSASEYISLLNTYSDHRAMPEHTKQLFESEIERAINENGNVFHIQDTIELYLARK